MKQYITIVLAALLAGCTTTPHNVHTRVVITAPMTAVVDYRARECVRHSNTVHIRGQYVYNRSGRR